MHIHPEDSYELTTMKKAIVGTMSAEFRVNSVLPCLLIQLLSEFDTIFYAKTYSITQDTTDTPRAVQGGNILCLHTSIVASHD